MSPTGIERLIEVMRRLRDPATGCPWDREQSFATIAPYTIEEAYEVADAIAREDWEGLEGELGDLLLQVVYHTQMAAEAERFDFDRVAHTIADKMIRRHPHVFGEAEIPSAGAMRAAWEQAKAAERAAKGAEGVLDDIPLALPALTRAQKLQGRAAGVRFDWPAAAPILGKIREELAEVELALAAGDAGALAEELGDLLFAVVNLARHLKLDAEAALRAANAKFERRFRAMEARGGAATLERWDALWEAVKAAEKG